MTERKGLLNGSYTGRPPPPDSSYGGDKPYGCVPWLDTHAACALLAEPLHALQLLHWHVPNQAPLTTGAWDCGRAVGFVSRATRGPRTRLAAPSAGSEPSSPHVSASAISLYSRLEHTSSPGP